VQHGDPVARLVLVVTAERVLADRPGRQDEFDVSAWFPVRQRASLRIGQRQRDNPGSFAADLLYQH
jgi:hypothetical protein